jgi:hypothetical protein
MTLSYCAASDLSAANGVQANSGKTITAISEWAFYCDLNPVKVEVSEHQSGLAQAPSGKSKFRAVRAFYQPSKRTSLPQGFEVRQS